MNALDINLYFRSHHFLLIVKTTEEYSSKSCKLQFVDTIFLLRTD